MSQRYVSISIAALLLAVLMTPIVSLAHVLIENGSEVGHIHQLSGVTAGTEQLFTRVLRRGDVGDDVLLLQKMLASSLSINIDDIVTGFYGPRTESAVKDFQRIHGLEPVGYVGPRTIALLNNQSQPPKGFPLASNALTELPQQAAAKARERFEAVTERLVEETGEYVKATGDAQARARGLLQIARERQTMVLSLIETDPGALTNVHDERIVWLKENLPASAARLIERRATLTGVYEVLHRDDFEKPENSRFEHYLVTKERRYRIHPTDKDNITVTPGDTIQVTGMEVAENIAVNTDLGASEMTLVENAPLPATNPKRLGVLLVTFEANPAQPFTHTELQNNLTKTATSINAFFTEASYGKVAFKGYASEDVDIYGWYVVPRSVVDPMVSCDLNKLTEYAKKEAALQGFALANYDVHGIIYPRITGSTCFGGGMGSVTSVPGWFSVSWTSNSSLNILAHELGHTQGVYHSARLSACFNESNAPVSISESCSYSEYGDSFDVMGSGNFTHFNNAQKKYLGWLDPGNVLTLSNTGTYNVLLAPIEEKTSGVQLVRIPKLLSYNNRYYVLEYRRPIGFDNKYPVVNGLTSPVQDGVIVRATAEDSRLTNTFLLNGVESKEWTTRVGQTFTDPVAGLRVTPTGTSTMGVQLTIAIDAGTCERRRPSASVSPSGTIWYTSTTEQYDYSVAVTNNDSAACGQSTFNITPFYPSTTVMTPSNNITVTLQPGETVTRVFKSGPIQPLPPGTGYTLGFKVENQNDIKQYIMRTADYFVDGASGTTNPSATLTAPTASSTISGSAIVRVSPVSTAGVESTEFWNMTTGLFDLKYGSTYESQLNTLSLRNGVYKLFAIVNDPYGKSGGTQQVPVTVLNGSAETTPPTVQITTPPNGSSVSSSVYIEATAYDASGIMKVVFYNGGTLLATDTTAPYSTFFNGSYGTHTITAHAYDLLGNHAISAPVSITIGSGDTTPPVTSISYPYYGTTVSGSVTVKVAAIDSGVGTGKVELYVDGTIFGSDTSDPYEFILDTTVLANGSHTLLAKGYDTVGNVSTSQSISVSVLNSGSADTTPPVTSITTPTSGAVVSGAVLVGATASDQNGVTKVEVYKNSTLVHTDTLAPYEFSWDTSSGVNGTHSLQAKAYDSAGNQGVSTPVSVTVSNPIVDDVTAPVVIIVAPANGTKLPAKGNVSVSVSASDASGIATITIFVDQQLKKKCSAVTTCTYGLNVGKLSTGTHIISTTATDASSNKNSATSTVSVTK